MFKWWKRLKIRWASRILLDHKCLCTNCQFALFDDDPEWQMLIEKALREQAEKLSRPTYGRPTGSNCDVDRHYNKGFYTVANPYDPDRK